MENMENGTNQTANHYYLVRDSQRKVYAGGTIAAAFAAARPDSEHDIIEVRYSPRGEGIWDLAIPISGWSRYLQDYLAATDLVEAVTGRR